MRIKAKRLWHYGKRALLLFFALSIASVLLLRWIPPFCSALMIENRVASWFAKGDYTARFDWVPMKKISPNMGVAVVAGEDQLFAEHFGFDVKAIEKAITYNEKHRKIRGASTISQQTAKNLFLWKGRSWVRKGFEAYFTVLIETLWSKERILEVYLNIVEFGDGIYGVEAAAQHFFHKPASMLTVSESALLASVLPNPHRMKVNAPSARVRERQAWILKQMQQLGSQRYIDQL